MPPQHPDGGADTPGVAAAPVALAGAMVPGVDRYIVTLSAHAEVFGVGITAMVGSMLVPPGCVTSGAIVPGGGFAAICGVESGNAAPLVGGPPGVELHTTVDALPSGDVGDVVPVVLPVVDVEEVAAAAADVDIPVAPPIADIDAIGTGGSPGAICPVGVAQVTTVPGVVGSEASGTGASVVSGTPGWVAAENGLGPLSGDVTIVPGVDARPMAVEPMVEICAGAALQPASRMAIVNSRRRIAMASPVLSWSAWPAPCAPRPCCLPPD
jgi:hypothetical protein